VLPAVDVVGRAGDGGVGHDVDGQRGDVGRADDAADRQRRPQFGAALVEVGAELDGTSTTYGGLNPGSKVNQIFGPTQNRAMEVGTKWELFDRRLLATAALFQTDVQNAREIIPTGYLNAGTVVAGAAYRVRGIDLEENLLMVEGAVPGPRDGYVLISKAKAPPRERRGFAGATTVDPLKASKKASAGKKSK